MRMKAPEKTERQLLFLQQSPPLSSPSLRPTFPPRTNPQPLAVPDALDQGIQTRNQSLLRNPSGLSPRSPPGPPTCRGANRHTGWARETRQHRHKRKWNQLWLGLGKEVPDGLGHTVTRSHAPLAAPVSNQELFSQDALRPQGPRARFRPLFPPNASKNSMRQALPGGGVGSCCAPHSSGTGHHPHLLPDRG